MLCELCEKNKSSVSAILNGTYYKNLCTDCKLSNNKVSSGHATWERSIDVEDSQFDIMQPWGSNGKPNPDFIKAYPEQSAAVFTQEEMEKALRH